MRLMRLRKILIHQFVCIHAGFYEHEDVVYLAMIKKGIQWIIENKHQRNEKG